MKTLRTTIAVLVLGLALHVPSTAFAQKPVVRVGTGTLILTSANTYQYVRVTIGFPALTSEPADTPEAGVPTGTVTFTVDGTVMTHEVAAGGFFTYSLDPRVDGQLVDPRTGLRHVPVQFEFATEVVEGDPAPVPSVTIELVHVRTGEVQSVHVFPGYTGVTRVNGGVVH